MKNILKYPFQTVRHFGLVCGAKTFGDDPGIDHRGVYPWSAPVEARAENSQQPQLGGHALISSRLAMCVRQLVSAVVHLVGLSSQVNLRLPVVQGVLLLVGPCAGALSGPPESLVGLVVVLGQAVELSQRSVVVLYDDLMVPSPFSF